MLNQTSRHSSDETVVIEDPDAFAKAVRSDKIMQVSFPSMSPADPPHYTAWHKLLPTNPFITSCGIEYYNPHANTRRESLVGRLCDRCFSDYERNHVPRQHEEEEYDPLRRVTSRKPQRKSGEFSPLRIVAGETPTIRESWLNADPREVHAVVRLDESNPPPQPKKRK